MTMQGEIRPGYRQTELGVIPEDWEVTTLGRFGSFSKGQGIRKDQAASGLVPCVRYGELYTLHHEIIREFRSHISPEIARTSKRLSSGDVLFAGSGETKAEIGKCAAFIDAIEAYAGGDIVIFSPRKCSAEFLGYLLNTPFVANQKASKGQGDAVVHISTASLASLVIAIPPVVEEQLAIAAALGDADALIAALEGMIAKKRNLKQAAMQHLLTGKSRLPGFSGEWEVKRLGEVFEIGSSKRVFQSDWKSHGIPFYRAREIVLLGEREEIDNQLFITRELYESHKSNSGVPEVGDVLVTGVGTLGRVFVVEGHQEFYFKDGNIIWFKIRGKMVSEFLRQLFLTSGIMKQITDSAGGSTVGTYTISDAKKTIIPFPSLAEQTAIAEVLSDMDAGLAALETQAAKARAVKQGMLQQLLTGQVRLV